MNYAASAIVFLGVTLGVCSCVHRNMPDIPDVQVIAQILEQDGYPLMGWGRNPPIVTTGGKLIPLRRDLFVYDPRIDYQKYTQLTAYLNIELFQGDCQIKCELIISTPDQAETGLPVIGVRSTGVLEEEVRALILSSVGHERGHKD